MTGTSITPTTQLMVGYRRKPVLDYADSEHGLGLNFQNILSSQEEHDFLSCSPLPLLPAGVVP